MNNARSSGYTLVEMMASITLLILALGMAMTGYLFALKNVNEGDVQNDLDIDVMLAMEQLKKDLRLSSLDNMHYYPDSGGPYQAISFPMADVTDGQILDRDEDGKIIWTKTVIYHIRPGDPDKLVKTTFSPRDDSLTDAERQAQLESVVDNGSAAGTYNAENATSKVLFENLLDWEISPTAGRFDAYSSTITRDQASLGYMLLDPGEHDICFEVVGKNAKSSGYHIGIDQLTISSSASAREAEAQLPVTAETGVSAVDQYVSTGSWKGNHQLYFPATSIGNSFTLTMENDRWEETNFGAEGYQSEDTRVVFDETLTPTDFVVELAGMDDTWKASDQTGTLVPSSPTAGLMKNWVVRVMQKGAELTDNGNWFAYNGRQCRLKFQAAQTGNFRVTNVYIGETASTTNASLDFNEATISSVKFDGQVSSPIVGPGETFESDWVDFAIDKEKNYLVSYRIANSTDRCHPAIWEDVLGSLASTCMVVTNETTATAKDMTWSDLPASDIMEMKGIIGLASIEASYPIEGTYVSQIFDTRITSPVYGDISWNADVPGDSTLAIKVRCGSQPDMLDADDWESLSAFTSQCIVPGTWKRYIQFQALMESSSDGQSTPKLKDVTIDWEGAMQLVNIGGIFTKGPDYGIFEISVDGDPLRSALVVDLEIYKDVTLTKGQQRRVTSSLKTEITPRNSGM